MIKVNIKSDFPKYNLVLPQQPYFDVSRYCHFVFFFIIFKSYMRFMHIVWYMEPRFKVHRSSFSV